MVTPGLSRCATADRCIAGENVHDPDTGEKIDRYGAIIHTGIICDACFASFEYSIAALRADAGDLWRLLPPSLQQKLRDPDLPTAPRIKLHAPLPVREDVLTLLELIDFETTAWANSVARAAKLDGSATATDGRTGQWLPGKVARYRWDVRLTATTELLGQHLRTLVALGPTEHPARSRTARRADGHDPDIATRSGDDYWTTRTGVEGAMLLRKLHYDAERYCGRAPGEKTTIPCPGCHRRAQYRDVKTGWVTCEACGRCVTDDEHEDLLDFALTVFGLEPVEYSERDPAIPTRRRPDPRPLPFARPWHNGPDRDVEDVEDEVTA